MPPASLATAALHSPIRSLALANRRDGHPGRLEHCARRGQGEGRAARRRNRLTIAHPAARAKQQAPEAEAAERLQPPWVRSKPALSPPLPPAARPARA